MVCAAKCEFCRLTAAVAGRLLLLLLCCVGPLLGAPQTARAAGHDHCAAAAPGEQVGATYTLRWGQGGFRDHRAEGGDVGGGQLALDIAPCGWPVLLSVSSEYYSESADPDEVYEIEDLYAIDLSYAAPLPGFERTEGFVGAGVGRLAVPYRGGKLDGDLFQVGAGLHWKRFERFGFYALLKYLYSREDSRGARVIDFSEVVVLFGVSYRFAI